MDSFVSWRGRVPAWECDADGRWSVRHAAGAFEQAARICAGQAEPAWPLTLSIDPKACPCAGDIVEIRSRLSGGTLEHVMIRLADGAELSRGEAARPAEGLLRVLEHALRHGAAGPLDIVDAWECDIMGHMNVQFYASRVTDAEAMFAAAPGPAIDGVVLRPREHRFSFLSELRAGNVASASTVRTEGHRHPSPRVRRLPPAAGSVQQLKVTSRSFRSRLGRATRPRLRCAGQGRSSRLQGLSNRSGRRASGRPTLPPWTA